MYYIMRGSSHINCSRPLYISEAQNNHERILHAPVSGRRHVMRHVMWHYRRDIQDDWQHIRLCLYTSKNSPTISELISNESWPTASIALKSSGTRICINSTANGNRVLCRMQLHELGSMGNLHAYGPVMVVLITMTECLFSSDAQIADLLTAYGRESYKCWWWSSWRISKY